MCGNAHSEMKKPRLSRQHLENGFTDQTQSSIQIYYQFEKFKVIGKYVAKILVSKTLLLLFLSFRVRALGCTKIHEISFVVYIYKGDIGSTISIQVTAINVLS